MTDLKDELILNTLDDLIQQLTDVRIQRANQLARGESTSRRCEMFVMDDRSVSLQMIGDRLSMMVQDVSASRRTPISAQYLDEMITKVGPFSLSMTVPRVVAVKDQVIAVKHIPYPAVVTVRHRKTGRGVVKAIQSPYAWSSTVVGHAISRFNSSLMEAYVSEQSNIARGDINEKWIGAVDIDFYFYTTLEQAKERARQMSKEWDDKGWLLNHEDEQRLNYGVPHDRRFGYKYVHKKSGVHIYRSAGVDVVMTSGQLKSTMVYSLNQRWEQGKVSMNEEIQNMIENFAPFRASDFKTHHLGEMSKKEFNELVSSHNRAQNKPSPKQQHSLI